MKVAEIILLIFFSMFISQSIQYQIVTNNDDVGSTTNSKDILKTFEKFNADDTTRILYELGFNDHQIDFVIEDEIDVVSEFQRLSDEIFTEVELKEFLTEFPTLNNEIERRKMSKV